LAELKPTKPPTSPELVFSRGWHHFPPKRIMKHSPDATSKKAVRDALAYLKSCGIRIPSFKLTAQPPEKGPIGGSFVTGFGGELQLNMGRYPTAFLRNWFAMHELGHILWAAHRPLRWKRFREEFGEPRPRNYEEIHPRESWKTAGSMRLSWLPGLNRPEGQPSYYGARGGGEERFCELIGLMYANGDFSDAPPFDLTELWECCWEHGLSRMT
jgi:hypothetical protein